MSFVRFSLSKALGTRVVLSFLRLLFVYIQWRLQWTVVKMPFFKRNAKPPKRRLDAGNTTLSKSNLSLAGTGELGESVNNALVKLKLGQHELSFQDGEWIAESGSQSSSKDGGEVTRLQKLNSQLKEENNYLKYKIEVLLDMMAASTADCNVMEKELDALQSQKQGRKVAR